MALFDASGDSGSSSGGFITDLGSIATDINSLETGITPLLVGAGVISPVSTIKSGGASTVTTSPGAKSVPGTFLGMSWTTILLILGGALILIGVFIYLLRTS